jgi:hypothetical protein
MDRANEMALRRQTTPNRATNGKITGRPDVEGVTIEQVSTSRPQPLQFRWAEAISKTEWAVYRSAIKAIRGAEIPFLLGGGFALATFTGRWRDTKDIDFYVLPEHRTAVVRALSKAGFEDYYRRVRYDRKWIHRNVKQDMIVDIIWSMANQRTRVDRQWFEYSGSVGIRGETISVIPMEEFLWCKLYILQRDHCDWTDIFNLLYAVGARINWDRLIRRLGNDIPLLRGMLSVYAWLCPKQSRQLPRRLWQAVDLRAPKEPEAAREDRIHLLDSRAWFAALHPRAKKLDV